MNTPLNQQLDYIASLSAKDVRQGILTLLRDVTETALTIESFCSKFEHLFTYGDRTGLSHPEERALSTLFDTVAYFGPKSARDEWDGHTDEADVLRAIAEVHTYLNLGSADVPE